ncbi:Methionyl-tRNA formyltransferase [Desulfovibrio sp. X2]|uniref:methionyl-tRNA formyltransferase n=1 Tax=Desulfovibrio sp. X2 TaxID=941449 RepID=UPI00035891C5|nr:methionyl-tRNA formyltransferase [Desulfovibrio sp. X2]EPR44003.1 Methionyl-tRNA formyltransferase [Desulfovibrio sp. X2]
MGTPDFAAEVLSRVLDWPHGKVVGVYTQPDRPCGRGQVCRPSPVKRLALERGLPVFQPVNFKAAEAVEELRALAPDLLLVAAYGLILPRSVLDIPRFGPFNVHASLLPKHRGAAPIQRALLAGDRSTGITIMRMEEGLDSGPMLLQRALAIGIEDTAQTLHDELAAMGGEMLCEVMDALRAGTLSQIPQDDGQATYAPKLRKEEGLIDWGGSAAAVHARIRAMTPWPGAYFHLALPGREKPLRVGVLPGRIGEEKPAWAAPGDLVGVTGCEIRMATADRVYALLALHPQGKKPMDGRAFACGYLDSCPEGQAKACSGDGL